MPSDGLEGIREGEGEGDREGGREGEREGRLGVDDPLPPAVVLSPEGREARGLSFEGARSGEVVLPLVQATSDPAVSAARRRDKMRFVMGHLLFVFLSFLAFDSIQRASLKNNSFVNSF